MQYTNSGVIYKKEGIFIADKKKPGAYTGYTEARKIANAKYEAETVERISLVLPKGKKVKIKAHASLKKESVNHFINRAIDETIERDEQA